VTIEQVQSKKDKAVRFLRDVLQDDDRADEVEDESPEDYAERKEIKISNSPKRRMTTVANGNGNDVMTKGDLQDCVDAAIQSLEDAYQPETSREDAMAAIGDALDALSGDYDDGADDDGGDDDDQG
jgi:hypothetical protein